MSRSPFAYTPEADNAPASETGGDLEAAMALLSLAGDPNATDGNGSSASSPLSSRSHRARLAASSPHRRPEEQDSAYGTDTSDGVRSPELRSRSSTPRQYLDLAGRWSAPPIMASSEVTPPSPAPSAASAVNDKDPYDADESNAPTPWTAVSPPPISDYDNQYEQSESADYWPATAVPSPTFSPFANLGSDFAGSEPSAFYNNTFSNDDFEPGLSVPSIQQFQSPPPLSTLGGERTSESDALPSQPAPNCYTSESESHSVVSPGTCFSDTSDEADCMPQSYPRCECGKRFRNYSYHYCSNCEMSNGM